MSRGMLGDLTRIPGDNYGFDGYLYVQNLHTSHLDYRVMFTPLGGSASNCKETLEQEVGCTLEGVHLEVKFILADELKSGKPINFSTPDELGLPTLSLSNLNELGLGLALSIREIQAQVRPDGFAALALSERPKLNMFYQRLYRSHAESLTADGYVPKVYLGGQGYALFETNYARRLNLRVNRTQERSG